MPEINITEFRKRLPYYLKQVQKGRELRITSHGKPIARIIPEDDELEKAKCRLMKLRGTMIQGDIVAPLNDNEWSGDADNL